MRVQSALSLVGIVVLTTAGSSVAHRRVVRPVVQANSNTQRAGVLHDGVLSVTLEAQRALWYLDGPTRPPQTIYAFAEPRKAPSMPGPLVRAPQGTEIRISIRNSLNTALTFVLPAAIHGGPDRLTAIDSIVIAPGAVGQITTRATAPGNYVYRATTPERANSVTGIAGALAGALVIDTSSAAPSHDRVFVIMATPDSAGVLSLDTAGRHAAHAGRVLFTINGRSWPNTERIHAAVGDSLHWRVVNASNDEHPMHLHGFYFRVDAFAGPMVDLEGTHIVPGETVVTQALSPFSAMSMTWSPDRPGNWLFHCHMSLHLQPDSALAARKAGLEGSLGPDNPHVREMAGLVIGAIVTGGSPVEAAGAPMSARRLRLVAVQDRATASERGPIAVPSMHFVIEDGARRIDTHTDFSPELDLVRGEPVAITIVNQLDRPTTVHWHGIELQDSYMDGVAGFSGDGQHLAPAIAPGDSFVARFTPPRAGTFMYHAHVDDVREELAGLVGALIVRDPGSPADPDDHAFFLKSSRVDEGDASPLEINGRVNPDTVVLHVGRAARLRLMNLSTHPVSRAAEFRLLAPTRGDASPPGDAQLQQWQPVAKDGRDVPARARAGRPAQQVIAMGETYDFAYTPPHRGLLWLDVRGIRARPTPSLIRVPIRVE